jgi:hypothetical protein
VFTGRLLQRIRVLEQAARKQPLRRRGRRFLQLHKLRRPSIVPPSPVRLSAPASPPTVLFRPIFPAAPPAADILLLCCAAQGGRQCLRREEGVGMRVGGSILGLSSHGAGIWCAVLLLLLWYCLGRLHTGFCGAHRRTALSGRCAHRVDRDVQGPAQSCA